VVTGASGVLGGAIARGLVAAGRGSRPPRTGGANGSTSSQRASVTRRSAVEADVLDVEQLERARARCSTAGAVSTCSSTRRRQRRGGDGRRAVLLRAPDNRMEEVVSLNFHGTVRPSQVFRSRDGRYRRDGADAVDRERLVARGASRAHSGSSAYGAAKAAVENLTRWSRGRAGTPRRACECRRARLLRRRQKSCAPARRVRCIDRARRADHRGDPGGPLRRAQSFAGHGDLVVQRRRVVRHRSRRPVDGGFDAFSGV